RADTSLRPEGYPGFAIHPPGERPEYFVADYLWPAEGNERIMGLDISSQPVNLASMRYSRESGKVVASAPFELVQETEHKLGFVIRVPVFARSPVDGQRQFVGAVAATARIHDIVMDIARHGRMDGLAVSITDLGAVRPGADAEPARVVFRSASFDTLDDDVTALRTLAIHDRRWQLDFKPSGSFVTPAEDRLQQVSLLVSGLAALLLGAVVTLLARQRAQALLRVHASDAARVESENRFHTLFNQAAVGVALVETDSGRLVDVNQKFCDVMGRTAQELRAGRMADWRDPRDAAADDAQMASFAGSEQGEFTLELRCIRPDGQTVWLERTVSAMQMAGAGHAHHIAVVQDITERKRMQDEVRSSEMRLRDMLQRLPVGLFLVRPDGRMTNRNEYFEQLTGYTEDDVPTLAEWWQLAYPDPEYRHRAHARWAAARRKAVAERSPIAPVEYRIRCKDGQDRSVDIAGALVGDDLLVTLIDLTQRKAAEEEIKTLAFYDMLTRLPNRRLLTDRMQQALATARRHRRHGALLILDLDNFKSLNDTRGHDRGDALLVQVANRLQECVHVDDTVARPGGDEFAVLLEDLGDTPEEAAAQSEEMGQKILAALREPYLIDGEAHHSTMSIGMTVFGGDPVSVDELFRRSELAMYQAKAAGRNTLQFFDPHMQAVASARAALEDDLRAGLEQRQLELFFQPQMDHGRITGAEALLRWRHPRDGYVSPARFIPVAEDSGLILPMGRWVLEQACATLAQWAQDPLLAELTLAVNVSPRQFLQEGFVQQVLGTLASTGASARRLELELTESLLLQDIDESVARMNELQSYGVGFSLDDFGTGYSSLAYLKSLPLDQLKIDQSFVRDVLTDPNDASIVRTILALGAGLGLQVIAEGVETEAQREFLERHHCHAWQGYLMSRPVPVEAFVQLVRERANG
ncbi:MAG: EAL domain-containing protein, partial [Giesbergeria sp.]|nr:EAL domain-containing protein [Giesbergeria sp.]